MTEQPCTWLDEHPEALSEEVRPPHLETCEQCRRQVEGLEGVLRRALAPEEVPVPQDLARRIEDAVAARYGGGRRPLPAAWLLAAALVVVLLLAAAGGAVVAFVPAESSHGPADAGALPRAREQPTVEP
jgi:hypothetical protein